MQNNKYWKMILEAFIRVVLECDNERNIEIILNGDNPLVGTIKFLETLYPKFTLRSFAAWMRMEGLDHVVDEILQELPNDEN